MFIKSIFLKKIKCKMSECKIIVNNIDTKNIDECMKTYKKVKKLGKGVQGEVFEVEDSKGKYALKIDEDTKNNPSRFLRELWIFKRLQNTKIKIAPKLHKFWMCNGNGYTVMEKFDDTLENHLLETQKIDKNLFSKFYKLCEVLGENNIMQGDMKPDNIMIKNGEIVVIDYGFSYSTECPEMFEEDPSWSFSAGWMVNWCMNLPYKNTTQDVMKYFNLWQLEKGIIEMAIKHNISLDIMGKDFSQHGFGELIPKKYRAIFLEFCNSKAYISSKFSNNIKKQDKYKKMYKYLIKPDKEFVDMGLLKPKKKYSIKTYALVGYEDDF